MAEAHAPANWLLVIQTSQMFFPSYGAIFILNVKQ